MCSKKTEKLMPQALKNWPNYKDGTKASTGEKSGRVKLDSGRQQKLDYTSELKVRPRLMVGVWAGCWFCSRVLEGASFRSTSWNSQDCSSKSEAKLRLQKGPECLAVKKSIWSRTNEFHGLSLSLIICLLMIVTPYNISLFWFLWVNTNFDEI